MRKLRCKNRHSNLPPIWWQNSKVSYSYFASGSSSFLDFSIKKDVHKDNIKRKDSHNNEGSMSPDELKTKTGLNIQELNHDKDPASMRANSHQKTLDEVHDIVAKFEQQNSGIA